MHKEHAQLVVHLSKPVKQTYFKDIFKDNQLMM
jgi:hypothetical protein